GGGTAGRARPVVRGRGLEDGPVEGSDGCDVPVVRGDRDVVDPGVDDLVGLHGSAGAVENEGARDADDAADHARRGVKGQAGRQAPLTSATASARGAVLVLAAARVPNAAWVDPAAVVLRSTVTVLSAPSVTIRSGLPSRSTSAIATAAGEFPAAKEFAVSWLP